MWYASQHHFFSSMTAKSPLSHPTVGFHFAAECPSGTHYSHHLSFLKCFVLPSSAMLTFPCAEGVTFPFFFPDALCCSAFGEARTC